jgi:pipecolate-incorporating enzyme
MASKGPQPESDRPGLAAARTQRNRRRPKERGITRADRSTPLLASFSQQRLWLLQEIAPESNAYNLPLVQRLRGALDATTLGQALGQCHGV